MSYCGTDTTYYYKRTSNWCFISTVVVNYLGKDDDCDELTLLRHFRDNVLMKSESGAELVNDYYKIAPSLVNKLKEIETMEEDIYHKLYDEYMIPVIKDIEKNRWENAIDDYQKMVAYLKDYEV